MTVGPVRAPFPWFGGKSRIASVIWQAFGPEISNYVEPFAGSLAVLLGRPSAPRTETVNDLDAYVANFWRAVAADPWAVADYADWPVNETDLHARHRRLVQQPRFRERMLADPDFFDVRVAGWWVWGVCAWIGSGWCAPEWGARGPRAIEVKRPSLSRGGRGMAGGARGFYHQIPDLSGDSGATGRGVHASGRKGQIVEWMLQLQERLRYVRVCCGDWSRILGPSPTTNIGTTGVFLDPPYAKTAKRSSHLYSHDCQEVALRVRSWAVQHGNDPKLRIALCGYEGEHVDMPGDWRCVAWKSAGGYGGQRKNGSNDNAVRERVWLSPACLDVRAKQLDLFGGPDAEKQRNQH